MKDINQKVKEAKKFRLHSILKLHTRILNQKLIKHALGLTSILENLMSVDKEVTFNSLVKLSLNFTDIGRHNFDVSKMANQLQLTSSQEELQELFKLVTKSDKETSKELKEESNSKNSKPNTSKVQAKVIEIVASSEEEALEKFKELLKEGKIK